MTANYRRYNREQLESLVPDCISYAGVLRRLGKNCIAGGNISHLKRRLSEWDIDTSHFLGQGHNKGRNFGPKRSAEEILVLKEPGSTREKAVYLRRAMVEYGVRETCVECGVSDEYNGKPIMLEVHHIDENPLDNRIENLCFLCPNCHSQV